MEDFDLMLADGKVEIRFDEALAKTINQDPQSPPLSRFRKFIVTLFGGLGIF